MSEQGASLPQSRIDSHKARLTFEKCGMWLIAAVIVTVILVAVGAILMRPPVPCGAVAGCIPHVDWGKSILERIISFKDTLFDLIGELGALIGLSMGRGAHDERLNR